MNQLTDNISIRGYSHLINKIECQDSSISWKSDKYCGIIVCDGHGGEKYIRSNRGSAIACSIGKNAIEEFMKSNIINRKNFDEQLTILERYIINNFRYAVQNELDNFPIDIDERFEALNDLDKNSLLNNPIKAYGTTFIGAVLAEDYFFIIKLGDGNACLISNSDEVELPDTLEDDELQFNVTTSLCLNSADIDFKHVYRTFDNNEIKSIIISSDGVINCFNNMDAYKSLILNIYHAYTEQEVSIAHDELEEGLNKFTEKGSGDDLSIAIVINK